MQGIQGDSDAGRVQGALKDITGAQVVLKTLDRMNTFPTITGPKIDAGYQFRKDVLGAAGIGMNLDAKI